MSGSHRAAIWQTFAAHGMGAAAYGVDGDYTTGFRYDAAYDLPPDLPGTPSPTIASDPLTISVGVGDPVSTNRDTGDVDLFLRQGQPARCNRSGRVVASCYFDHNSAHQTIFRHLDVSRPNR